MEFEELLKKYQALLTENKKLKKEIERLKVQQLSVTEQLTIEDKNYSNKLELESSSFDYSTKTQVSHVDNSSSSLEKIKLFMSLFKGREDVYAERVVNKKGKPGYFPVCLNIWKPGICGKLKKRKCADCDQKDYAALDEKVIEEHLLGGIVAGIYPMLVDESCNFLAIDFDGESWKEDVSAIRNVCLEFNVSMAVERSRSGKGAHVWFFFEKPVPAKQARKLDVKGTLCLTYRCQGDALFDLSISRGREKVDLLITQNSHPLLIPGRGYAK